MKLSEMILGPKPTVMVKGGHNEKPTRPRPLVPPKAQGGYPGIETMKKFSLKKDDVIILTTEAVLTDEKVARMKRQIKEAFPNNKVIVIAYGVSLEVITNQLKKQ